MTRSDSSILSAAEHGRRCAILAELTSVPMSALQRAEDWHLDILAMGVLARWGYVECPARGWRVRVRYLPLWSAIRAHLRDMRAIEARLVAEHAWYQRRSAA